MKYLVPALALVCNFAMAADAPPDDPYKPFKGEFSIYSGELNDQGAPTANERKISFISR